MSVREFASSCGGECRSGLESLEFAVKEHLRRGEISALVRGVAAGVVDLCASFSVKSQSF